MTRSSTTARHVHFETTTQWAELQLAAQARDSQAPEAHAALQAFCRRYWPVVHSVVRRKYGDARAEDLTQSFFLKHLLVRCDLAKLDPEYGRFRNWLRTTLQRFLIDEWRTSVRSKRDYRIERPLEEVEVDGDWVGSDYDRLYACTLAERAIVALHARWAPKLRRRDLEVEPALLLRWLIDRDAAALADKLGVKPDNARQLLHRLHKDLGRALRAEVADTVTEPSELQSELDEVCRILGIQPPERTDA